MKRPAAGLSRRDNDLAAVLLQHAHRGFVQAREGDIGDTTCHHHHSVPARSLGGKSLADLAEEKRNLGGRRKRFAITEWPEQFQDTQKTQNLLQPAHLVNIKHRAGGGQQHRRRQKFPKNEIAGSSAEPGAARIRFNLGARGLHQSPVLHSRRTGAFATPAGEAEIDVFPIGIADGLSLGDLNHLIDAPARRIHFDAEFAIGGTGVEAETAMHAAVEILLTWLVDIDSARNRPFGLCGCDLRADRRDVHD